jgi:hypothetical protein
MSVDLQSLKEALYVLGAPVLIAVVVGMARWIVGRLEKDLGEIKAAQHQQSERAWAQEVRITSLEATVRERRRPAQTEEFTVISDHRRNGVGR